MSKRVKLFLPAFLINTGTGETTPIQKKRLLSYNESEIFTNDFIDDATSQRDTSGTIFPSRNGINLSRNNNLLIMCITTF